MKKTLIYGGGVMGSFLAHCLYSSKHKIFFLCRKKHYKICKKRGLTINIHDNELLKKRVNIKENENFNILNNLNKIKKGTYFDYIFITTKITENLKKILLNVNPFINNSTALIPPCTSIPFWWYQCLEKKKKRKFEEKNDQIFLKNIKRKNIIGMTMWLSGIIEKPGTVKINHIQRGFPVKEVFNKFKKKTNILRNDIKKECKSPNVKNVFSEIFIKSTNAMAFNLIALETEKSNAELKKDKNDQKKIFKILCEGDNILKKNKIKIFQSVSSRINQTLSSTKHTLSMLTAYKNGKKIEIENLWKSFENLINILNLKMNFTKEIFLKVKKKLK